jgi:hypothetical protein
MTWTVVGVPSLQHATVGGLDVAMMNGFASDLQVTVDGGASFSVPLGTAARDAAPFGRSGALAAVAVTAAGGALLVPAVGMTPVFISLPGGFWAQFVSMTTE